MRPFPRLLSATWLLFLLLSGGPHPLTAAPANYAGQDLSRRDFHNENLNGANFEGARLEFADLTNATCKDANFRRANLSNARLAQTVLEGADLTGAELTGATLHDARLRGAKLPGVTVPLAGATRPDYAKVEDFRAQQTLLANAERTSGALSFEYADLRGAVVLGNAEGVDFRYTDLRGADFSRAENLDKARLKGAKYDAATRWKIDPAAMGAVLTAPTIGTPPPATGGSAAVIAPSGSPVVGHWIILKERGVTEAGILNVNADGTFEWDYSSKSPRANGSWAETAGKARLRNGELGREWTVTVKAKDELLLESGQDARVAVRRP